ncbi:Lrp/AsnC family transcriptional regulator [Methanobacterium sp. ACI-7]|uniref:Lrp/AsnC family transcriptional regulator n=1 Tax=unclassified Methanobacterium TaxID=2627676 RepID=UPI0039C3ACC2
MDDVDLAILRSLIKNSRITISQMSKEIDVPDATISNRLKKLEDSVIKRYTMIPDWQTVGLEITSIIIIQTESEKHESVKEMLSKLDEVSEVYSVSGEYDILIKVWVKSIEELNQLVNAKIRSIDGIEDLTEMIVMERVKEDIPTL